MSSPGDILIHPLSPGTLQLTATHINRGVFTGIYAQ